MSPEISQKYTCLFYLQPYWLYIEYLLVWMVWFQTEKEKRNYHLQLFSEWVIEGLLFNANSAIFQLYHGENMLIFNEMMMRSALLKMNTLSSIFIVLAHWNNSSRIDMSLHSDTLFWFRAYQSLPLLLNAACLVEKQQIPIS